MGRPFIHLDRRAILTVLLEDIINEVRQTVAGSPQGRDRVHEEGGRYTHEVSDSVSENRPTMAMYTKGDGR